MWILVISDIIALPNLYVGLSYRLDTYFPRFNIWMATEEKVGLDLVMWVYYR